LISFNSVTTLILMKWKIKVVAPCMRTFKSKSPQTIGSLMLV
jgi:hypothetical protein